MKYLVILMKRWVGGAERERASRNKTFLWKYTDKSSDETLQEKRK